MTTFVQFAPAPRQAFRFQPVLDGVGHQAVCTWSLFGNGENAISQRWLLSIYTLTGARVCTIPRTGSADPLAVASAAWDGTRQRVTVSTLAPHGFVVGSVVALTYRNFAPAAFNGAAVLSTVLDASTVAFHAPDDPGAATVLGSVASEVNLAAGYFKTSTLVFRTSSNRFEVEP